MIDFVWPFARPMLQALDAETAHDLTIRGLATLPIPKPLADDPRLGVEALGLRFPNPVGLAAGFDKDGRVPDRILQLSFGFVEVGTVTPRPQPGNPRPRAFRLPADHAVINRYGFNSEGHAAMRARLLARRGRPGIVGVNIGANKDTADRAEDYVQGVRAFADLASYLTVNISSPNTAGLRDLQARAALDDLLARVISARDAAGRDGGARPPVLVKIAPDLSLAALDDVVAVALDRGVDGLIVSNTTLSRAGLSDGRLAGEAGGLSGRPLFRRSTWMLAETFRRVEGRLPLIGVGGIDSAEAALRKLRAGATLLQLYTGLVFEGPGLVGRIKAGLLAAIEAAGAADLSPLVGADAARVAAEGPGEA